MANQTEQDIKKKNSQEMRVMWIAVGLIVLILVGGMGINMLVHHETSANPAETSAPAH